MAHEDDRTLSEVKTVSEDLGCTVSTAVIPSLWCCQAEEVTDLKRQAVEEMMDRIKKGVHLRPVNQTARPKAKRITLSFFLLAMTLPTVTRYLMSVQSWRTAEQGAVDAWVFHGQNLQKALRVP